MKPIFLLILILALGSAAFATNTVYISQSGAGSANGTSCANAEPATYFNASGNWSSTPTGIQIGPDTTVIACGTFTGTANSTMLTFQGSGSSGHPVILRSDSVSCADFTSPYWGSNGAIYTNGKDFITIDGTGTGDSGAIPSTFSACGVIENTANGTALANQHASKGISVPSGSGLTIQNLAILNIYQRSGTTTEAFDDTTVNCVYWGSAGAVNVLTIQNNQCERVGWALLGNNADNVVIANNDIGGAEHSIVGAPAHVKVFGNHMHDWGLWDAPCPSPCAYHHDGFHCFAGSGGNTQLLEFYNNQCDGATGSGTSGLGQFNQCLFMEGNGSATTCMVPGGTAHVFNNVCLINVDAPGCLLVTGNATTGDVNDLVVNNTNLGATPSDSASSGNNVQASSLATVENNAYGGFGAEIASTGGVAPLAALDYNFYENCTTFNCFFVAGVADTGSFTAWKAASCTGSANTCDQHGGANLSSSTYLSLNSACVLGSVGQSCAPQSASPLIAAGTNLYSVCNGQPNPGLGALCSDKAGNARPSTGAWTIGAFNGSSATHTCTRCAIASTGNDSNSGTEGSPWLHFPGMDTATGNAASQVPQPGDSYVIRGGTTLHYGNSSLAPFFHTWVWTWSGTVTNPIYIGVDQTWFTGSSWVRPVITGDNALSTAFVSGCTYDQSSSTALSINGTSYVTVDNFEFPGRCWSTGAGSGAAISDASTCNVTISNNYFHGWTAKISSADNQLIFGLPLSGSCGIATGNVYANNVFDGVDSSHQTVCGQGYEPLMPCWSGVGIYGDLYDAHQNVFRYMSNFAVAINLRTYHDNLAEYLYPTYQPGGPHSNVINDNSGASLSGNIYFYNNIVRHNYVSELVSLWIGGGATIYVFNNVFFDNLRYDTVGDTAPANCLQMEGGGGTNTVDVYQNTFDNDTDDSTGGGCGISFIGDSGNPGQPWVGPANFQNNHFIGYTNLSSFNYGMQFNTGGTGSVTPTDILPELYQATATARSQGYTQPTNDGPANGSTVHAGANLTSSCSTFSSDAALCNGTSQGVDELNGSDGGKTTSYPAIPLVGRGSTWDVGAYEFAGTPFYTLTVTNGGNGAVGSLDGGINCPPTCSASYVTGSIVTLVATPLSGYQFAGWSANSSCSGTGNCTLAMNSAQSVTATFTPLTGTYTLTVTVNAGADGSGSVSSSPIGIACPTICSYTFPASTAITLSALAGAGSGYAFSGWVGAGCAGVGTCAFTLSANTSVTANFSPIGGPAPLIVSPNATSFAEGVNGNFTVTATGHPRPSFLLVGKLPAGATFVDNGNYTASLGGIATVSGLFQFTIEATNGVLPNANQSFSLTVTQLPVITSASSATFIQGQNSSFTVTSSGYTTPQITETGALPVGITFVQGGSGTAVLSGLPTIAGSYPLTITGTNSVGAVNQSFVLNVAAPNTGQYGQNWTLNAVQPPTTGSNTNYAAWQSVLASGNNLFTGATAIIAGGCSSACSQLTYIDQGTAYPAFSFATTDALVGTYTVASKKANLLIAPSIEGGQNNGTPTYVYGQDWANKLDVTGTGAFSCCTWAQGTVYRVLNYVCVGTCPGTGIYWQMTGTTALPGSPGSSTYGIGCVAFQQPAFVHGGGPYTETGAPYPCTWTEVGTSAPPEDVICSTNFQGTNCYSVAATNAQRSGGTAQITLTNHTFSVGNSVTVNISDSAFNGNFTVTGVSSTYIQYALAGTQSSEAVTGTVAGTHLLNINTPNATLALLASGLPVAYEMPFQIWRDSLCTTTIVHYNAGQLNGGYLVCGYEGGGEYSTFGVTSQPMYGSAAQFKSIWTSGINDLLRAESATNPTMTLYGDMNAVGGDFAYTDLEAAMEVANNIGLRTNGLQVADIINIVCSSGVSSTYCSSVTPTNACDNPPSSATLGCTQGGWYRNKYVYATNANGTPSKLSLQTLTGSTPTNCQNSASFPVSGPLGPLATGADCPEPFPGLINSLVALRTVGLVGIPAPIIENVDNLEIYTNGPASCTTNCSHYDNSAYPVGDMLFSLDPTYSSTTYAQPVTQQQLPYQAAFALFLNTPTIYGGCPGIGAQCATATWSIGAK